jgi:hypothetical protein
MGRKDLNAPERIQREKVRVACDDVCSLATHRQFEELVVLCISASSYLYIHINSLSLARQSYEKQSNIFLIHISVEPFSTQDFIQFGERREGNQDSSFSQRHVKCLARFRIGQEQSAD